MINIDNILNRSTVQYISASILGEGTSPSVELKSFTEREESANDTLDQELKKIVSDEDYVALESIINTYTSTLTDIHFSLGIKTGARLMHQLLSESDKDY